MVSKGINIFSNTQSLYMTQSHLRLQRKVNLRLLRTFAGVLPCPPGKNSHACHFKGKHGKLYIVRKVDKCRFWKKIRIANFCNSAKENCKNDREDDHVSFNQTNELIGYQNLVGICKIWPEHSLDVVKQKHVGDF